MQLTRIVFSVVLLASLGACSKGGDSVAQPVSAQSEPASEAKDSTSLSIDTNSGAVSYDSQDGADKTSISVGGDGDKK
jgi:hypothetical protein